MSSPPHIEQLSEKIELLMRSDRANIRNQKQLADKLGIEPDYLSKIKGNNRSLSNEVFLRLCGAFSINQRDMFDELEIFGRKLGFTRNQVQKITGGLTPGIDFSSRIKDSRMVSEIFDILEGYWESYYYSVSKVEEKVISKDLLYIDSLEDDLYINCKIIDGAFTYVGHCFPIKTHLYFILEKQRLSNEIIVYTTNLPDREPPKLDGVILCLSGGIDETVSYPSAAKVAFRYLGKNAEEIKSFYPEISGCDENLLTELSNLVPGYLDPETSESTRNLEIINTIDNSLSINDIPFALRMKK